MVILSRSPRISQSLFSPPPQSTNPIQKRQSQTKQTQTNICLNQPITYLPPSNPLPMHNIISPVQPIVSPLLSDLHLLQSIQLTNQKHL